MGQGEAQIRVSWLAIAAPLVALATPLLAQDGEVGTKTDAVEVDPATLTRPTLDFAPTPEIEADFEKYFYFHRANTDLATAYADIRECDALASGSSIYLGGNPGQTSAAIAQYGALAEGVGSAIGSAVADAIFGSAERRKQRRVSLRNCMGFKEYRRFGLAGELWKKFNFEEGMGRKKEDVRDDALLLQALVASGPAPKTTELGL